MPDIIILQGPPAVGKTTTAKQLIHTLKLNYNKDCAYIAEDNFRKQMQYKYKAKQSIVYKNAYTLITTVIKTLLKIDTYDVIVIEGLFRYKDVVQQYEEFFKKNQFPATWFTCTLPVEILQKRDSVLRQNKAKDIAEITEDLKKYTPANAIQLDMHQTTKDIVQNIITIISK